MEKIVFLIMGIILLVLLVTYPTIIFIKIYTYNFKIRGIKSKKDLNKFKEKFDIFHARVKQYYKDTLYTVSIESVLATDHLLKISEFDEIKTNKDDLFEEFSNTLSRKEFTLNKLLDTYTHEKFMKMWSGMPIELYAYIYFRVSDNFSLKGYEKFKIIEKVLINRLGFKKLKNLK